MKRMITALMLLCCLVRPAWAQMLETAAEFAAGFDAEYPPVGEVREETSWYGTTTWEGTWTPDENGPDGVTYHARGGDVVVPGTTGVMKLTRRDDGAFDGQMTLRVARDSLTITLLDADGNRAVYSLPFDEEGMTYLQPEAMRPEFLSVDTSRLDFACWKLPGAETVIAQNEGKEHFAIVNREGHRALVYIRDGVEVWRNDHLTALDDMGMFAMQEIREGGSVWMYRGGEVMRGETCSLYASLPGDEKDYEDFRFSLERKADGQWVFSSYEAPGLHGYLFDDCTLFYVTRPEGSAYGWLSFETVNAAAETFFQEALAAVQERLLARLEDAPRISYFCGAETLYIAPGRDVTFPVYMRPDAGGPRADGAQAAVSLNDWVCTIGCADNWLLLFYPAGEGEYRMGWVDATTDEQLARVLAFSQLLCFEGCAGTAWSDTRLFADPLTGSCELCMIPEGTQLSVLDEGMDVGADSLDVCYVSVNVEGEDWYGFVRSEDVQM